MILDGDKPGQKSKKDYQAEFDMFINNKIFTYLDIVGEEATTEDLFSEKDIQTICDSAFGVGTFQNANKSKHSLKSKFNFSLLQLLNTKKEVPIEDITKQKFEKIFKFIDTIHS